MIDLPDRVKAGDVIPLSRALRRKRESLKGKGAVLAAILEDLDRQGFDADIVVRPKRGRPSNLSRFLSLQTILPLVRP